MHLTTPPPSRIASCSCGQLQAQVSGEPVRVSVCHCLACQRRTGSVFGAQARFPREAVTVVGTSAEYVRVGFADPSFPAPSNSVYEERMHSWVSMPTEIERMA